MIYLPIMIVENNDKLFKQRTPIRFYIIYFIIHCIVVNTMQEACLQLQSAKSILAQIIATPTLYCGENANNIMRQ